MIPGRAPEPPEALFEMVTGKIQRVVNEEISLRMVQNG